MTIIKTQKEKKVLVVFGTRPEAIKMCPLVKELQRRIGIKTLVAVTGQHRSMLDQVLKAFNVTPDYDLSIMKDKQTLFDITINVLKGIKLHLLQRWQHFIFRYLLVMWKQGLEHTIFILHIQRNLIGML